jgi:hypothetical protein
MALNYPGNRLEDAMPPAICRPLLGMVDVVGHTPADIVEESPGLEDPPIGKARRLGIFHGKIPHGAAVLPDPAAAPGFPEERFARSGKVVRHARVFL